MTHQQTQIKKKIEIYNDVQELIGKYSWKEWVQPATPHNVEAAEINTTGLNKALTDYIYKLLKG